MYIELNIHYLFLLIHIVYVKSLIKHAVINNVRKS